MNNATSLSVIALVAVFAGCLAAGRNNLRESQPTVIVRPSPLIFFRGANSTNLNHVGETDCNSPAHWDGNRLYVFNSAGHPWRSGGTDLFHLTNDYRRCQ